MKLFTHIKEEFGVDIYQCNACGAMAETIAELKHYPNCGGREELIKWEEYYKEETELKVLIHECNRVKVLIGNNVYWYEGIVPYKYKRFNTIRRISHGKAIQFLEKNCTKVWKVQPLNDTIERVIKHRKDEERLPDQQGKRERVDSFWQDAFCFG